MPNLQHTTGLVKSPVKYSYAIVVPNLKWNMPIASSALYALHSIYILYAMPCICTMFIIL